MKSSPNLTLATLCSVPFIMVLGNSMLIPILPLMREALNATLFQVGLFVTAFSLPAGLTIPFAGFLSDRVGRVKVMAPALVLYGLGGLTAGLAALLAERPYGGILAGRIIQGIGAGGTYQLAMALAGDTFPSRERARALGLLESSNGMGKVVSPLAGSAVALIAWFAPFFVYGLLAIPAATLVWLFASEPKSKKIPRTISEYMNMLMTIARKRSVPLLGSYFAGFTVMFLLFGALSYFSDVFENAHRITGFALGLVIALPVLVMALTSYAAGMALQKRQSGLLKLSVVAGLGLVAISLGALAMAGGTASLLALLGLQGLGTGLVLPGLNTLITSSASTGERGLITALYGTVRFFGVAVGPPAFGRLSEITAAGLLGGTGALALGAAIVAFLTIKPGKMMAA